MVLCRHPRIFQKKAAAWNELQVFRQQRVDYIRGFPTCSSAGEVELPRQQLPLPIHLWGLLNPYHTVRALCLYQLRQSILVPDLCFSSSFFKTALNGTRFLIYQSRKDAKENKTRLSKGNLSMQTVSNQNVFGTLSEPFISDITIVSHHPSHPPL